MVDYTLVGFLATEFLYLVGGALLIAFGVVFGKEVNGSSTMSNVADKLLLMDSKMTLQASIANGVLVFATFLFALPALVMPLSKAWLRWHGWLITISGLFTLVLGLVLWFFSLKTRSELATIWGQQPTGDQSLLQMQFNCCGYTNSTSPPFVQDQTCSNADVAFAKGGCITNFSNFGNKILDIIFTGAFGIVGVDAVVLLATLCMLKKRDELERYRYIDEKSGFDRF